MESKELFYTDKNLNGQSQCYGCKQKGKFNVGWSCMMWILKENGHHYCDECKKEIEVKKMNKIGRNKTLFLKRQECIFRDEDKGMYEEIPSTVITTKYNEYIGLADSGKRAFSVNFIYKHRLTNLMSINRAKGLPLSEYGCNAVSIGFSEKEQTWYGWTHRGYGAFEIGYEIKQGSIMDSVDAKYQYPFKVETLEQAKELAIHIAEYLD